MEILSLISHPQNRKTFVHLQKYHFKKLKKRL